MAHQLPDSSPGPVAATEAEAKKPASFGEMLFGQFVLLIFCVGLPAIFTATSPLSVVRLTRENGIVSADVSKRLLFLLPYSHTTIQKVASIGDQFVSGSTSHGGTGSSGSRSVQSEDSAYLTIEGSTGSVKVEVSPVNIDSVLKKTESFVADPSQPSLRLITIANWKFGVFAGGILSLFTLLWIYVEVAMLVRWIMRLAGK